MKPPGSGLGGDLGAGDQNYIAVENGLCDAEEARYHRRIVVGVHGGLIQEPLSSLNGKSGMYEIGVRPSVSGDTEVIMHRFFKPIP